ncbi:MAG: hypothetical protein HN509_06840 [Halobacteriovoraceae bacterium]|jgi:hypothetical protein|nr:hypothetical protein [Halobacteriovoraceae bacterium]MBT5093114.1 hypothetical protein [Halobacteriovoraceae bacterium]
MKSRYLLILLIGLTVFTYYFEELGQAKKELAGQDSITLFKPQELGKLLKISTRNASFYKKKGNFYSVSDDRLIDIKKLNNFLELLTKIKIKRKFSAAEIVGKEGEFFPHKNDFFKFGFEKDELVFFLGKKLDFDTSFYMQVKRGGKSEYFVAFDSSALEEAYKKSDRHKAAGKYRRLKTLAYLKDSFYLDTHVFKKKYYQSVEGQRLNWHSFELATRRNKKFAVDFSRQATYPKAVGGLGYKKEIFKQLATKLTQLKSKEIYFPIKHENLKKKIGEVVLTDLMGQKFELKLYRQYGSLDGYFLTSNTEESVFDLGKEDVQIFFLNHQDFWDLKAIKIEKDRKFAITFKDKTHQLEIINGKKFGIIRNDIAGKEPRHSAFLQLFRFLTNQADRVASIDPVSQLKNASQILLDWQQNPIRVIFKENEIIAQNLKEGIQLHYKSDKISTVPMAEEHYFISP